MLHVMVLTSSSGVGTVGRLTIEPMGGLSSTDCNTTARAPNILQDEMKARIAIGPVAMRLMFELANGGDPTDDVTTPWPEGRCRVSLGTVLLGRIAHDEWCDPRTAFDPAGLAPGIGPAGDPMLAIRSEV